MACGSFDFAAKWVGQHAHSQHANATLAGEGDRHVVSRCLSPHGCLGPPFASQFCVLCVSPRRGIFLEWAQTPARSCHCETAPNCSLRPNVQRCRHDKQPSPRGLHNRSCGKLSSTRRTAGRRVFQAQKCRGRFTKKTPSGVPSNVRYWINRMLSFDETKARVSLANAISRGSLVATQPMPDSSPKAAALVAGNGLSRQRCVQD